MLDRKIYPEFHPITSSRYYRDNDAKQSDEIQATQNLDFDFSKGMQPVMMSF